MPIGLKLASSYCSKGFRFGFRFAQVEFVFDGNGGYVPLKPFVVFDVPPTSAWAAAQGAEPAAGVACLVGQMRSLWASSC